MISYIGGKARIGKWIVPYIPNDIETYVEGFSGMFWVYFNMELNDYPNLKTVVYNDFNKLNTNLFKWTKQYDTFWDALSQYPCQQLGVKETPPEYEQMFNEYQKEIFSDNFVITEENSLEVACKYVYVLGQVFSGSKPETASYLDPPYWKTENYYSNHDFDSNDHERLSNVIKSIQGKFSLSYYDFPQLQQWFPQYELTIGKNNQLDMFGYSGYTWEKKDFSKAASTKKEKNIGTELLIMNY